MWDFNTRGLRSCWPFLQNPPVIHSACKAQLAAAAVCAKYSAEIFCTHDSNKYGGPAINMSRLSDTPGQVRSKQKETNSRHSETFEFDSRKAVTQFYCEGYTQNHRDCPYNCIFILLFPFLSCLVLSLGLVWLETLQLFVTSDSSLLWKPWTAYYYFKLGS